MNNLLDIVDEKGNRYYGGDQSWYSSNTRALGGCGSVAGANVIRALVHKNRDLNAHVRKGAKLSHEIKRALLNKQVQKEDYELLMTDVYQTMRAAEIFPLNIMYDKADRNTQIYKTLRTNFGKSSVGFVRGLLKYGKRCNIALQSHFLPTAFCDRDKAIEFIKTGLEHSGAVVILTSFNMHNLHMHSVASFKLDFEDSGADESFAKSLNISYKDTSAIEPAIKGKGTKKHTSFTDKGWNCEMKGHFATITDLIYKMDTPYLVISTWGKPAEINMDELVNSWKSIKAYQSSLFYFTSDERVNTLKGTLGAIRKYIDGILYCFMRKNKA